MICFAGIPLPVSNGPFAPTSHVHMLVTMSMYVYMYIYIYICIYVCVLKVLSWSCHYDRYIITISLSFPATFSCWRFSCYMLEIWRGKCLAFHPFAGEDAGEVCGCASALPAEDHRTGSWGVHGFFLVKGMSIDRLIPGISGFNGSFFSYMRLRWWQYMGVIHTPKRRLLDG